MTAQQPEVLIYNGDKYGMTTCPSIDEKVDYLGMDTSCCRGYVGHWEIKDYKLYLNDVTYGHLKEPGPIFADWVSEELHFWAGPLLNYVHAGYSSMYERDVYIKIDKGIVLSVRRVSNVPEYREFALKEVKKSDSMSNLGYLHSCYLDEHSTLTRAVKEAGGYSKQALVDLQTELECAFKTTILRLSQNPENGVKLVYREDQ